MRIDLYSRVMLTVIALCLVWLSVGGASVIPKVSAQAERSSGYQRVMIAGWLDADGYEHALTPKAANALPVNVYHK